MANMAPATRQMIHQSEDAITAIKEAVEESDLGRRSNVAVLSGPFYGEDAAWIEEAIGPEATRIDGTVLTEGRSPPENAKVVIIERLHRLYSRKVGGFDPIKKLMRTVASSEQLFIVTCNAYSWRYLEVTLQIGRLFPIRIELPLLDASHLQKMLLSSYRDGELQFLVTERPAGDIEEAPVSFMGRSLVLPRGMRALLRLLRPVAIIKSPADIFFNHLVQASGGNPGIAKMLWNSALDYPMVQEVPDVSQDLELDLAEAFAMSLILSAESISKDELFSIIGQSDDLLYSLIEKRLVNLIDGGRACGLRPEAVRPVADLLKRRRMIW